MADRNTIYSVWWWCEQSQQWMCACAVSCPLMAGDLARAQSLFRKHVRINECEVKAGDDWGSPEEPFNAKA